MSGFVSLLDQELAATLEAARARRRLPAKREPAAELARNIVGAPRPAPLGCCVFCGTPAPNRSTCEAHRDLEDLDPATCEVVTSNTNGSGRTHLDGGRAAGATGGEV